MNIGYLILAHRNLNQLAVLINLLTFDNNNCFCFVHIDKKKINSQEIELLSNLIISENFKILENSIDITWGGFSMIEATFSLIKAALDSKTMCFDYLSLHSGEDLPIKSNNYIKEYLCKLNGRLLLENFEITPNGPWNGNGGLDRLQYNWFIDQIGYSESKKKLNIRKQKVLLEPIP